MNLFKFRQKQKKEQSKPTIIDSNDDKSSVITLVREFIAGDVFLKEAVQKQFLYVLLLVVLSLVYINNRFLYERQLREIASLRNEVVDLRYRSLTISKEVKQAGRRTMIIEALKSHGSDLEEATKPIIIIEN
ncbi:MAG: hypothetical protein IJY67_09275 [Paludibacteraceae bacterium]|nr:hypothetical protein [Paludibacteraceae bacterium]